ncbi:MAG: SDR family oxidoreductase [Planctomycetaceae bacterium]
MNRAVLITGGGTGIGAACALALAEQGCGVAIAGRREEPLVETARRFTGEPKILTHTVDVGDRASAIALVDWATEKLGRIDVLINSAGVNVPKRSMEDLPPDDWDQVLNINATGAYNLMYAVLPQMRERRDGLMINISSIAGIRASQLGGVAYSASKFALSALSTCVAVEEKDRGIRVTNIYPGEVETPILDRRPVPVSAEHRARILQPEDVAAAVLMIVDLPPRAHVSDMIIKPTTQPYS